MRLVCTVRSTLRELRRRCEDNDNCGFLYKWPTGVKGSCTPKKAADNRLLRNAKTLQLLLKIKF